MKQCLGAITKSWSGSLILWFMFIKIAPWCWAAVAPTLTLALSSMLIKITFSGPSIEAISSKWYIEVLAKREWGCRLCSSFAYQISLTGTVYLCFLPSIEEEFRGKRGKYKPLFEIWKPWDSRASWSLGREVIERKTSIWRFSCAAAPYETISWVFTSSGWSSSKHGRPADFLCKFEYSGCSVAILSFNSRYLLRSDDWWRRFDLRALRSLPKTTFSSQALQIHPLAVLTIDF